MGRSRGGLTTKLHFITDGTGTPIKFQLTKGQTSDYAKAQELLKGQKAEAVLADKGYDSDEIVHFINDYMNAKAVIPPKCNRKSQRYYDKQLYKARNL